jgi:hypothetical protein
MTNGAMSMIQIQYEQKPVFEFSSCIPLRTILRARDFDKVLNNYKSSMKSSFSNGWDED